jgi:hypothetical protein
MKYILIQNDSEIEINSFELIGASTKRGQTDKIGFFGSGLKYSIAYMMRNSIQFRIFSGLNEITFTTQAETLKDQSFDRICINGSQTSYTTTMGPTWTEDWFVLREIYCNAIDEAGCQMVKSTESVQPSEGKTRIYIELTESLARVINAWDCYFSDERTPIFTVEKVYTSGLGLTDGSQKSLNYQKAKVFNKTDGVLFRKGIRVFQKKSYLYDYEFQYIDINEDRTAKTDSGISYAVSDMFGQFVNEEWIKSILRSSQDETLPMEYYAITNHKSDQRYSEKWIRFSNEHLLVVKEFCGKYAKEIIDSKKETFLIPSYIAKDMKTYLPAINILGLGKMVGDIAMTVIEMTPKMEYLLKEVIQSLSEMQYTVPFDCTVVHFESNDILGQADVSDKQIFLSAELFDRGRREIAATLMEECEHIRSGCADETKGFQNHLISSWLTAMENANVLFL